MGDTARGWFGDYGGQFVPETLMPALLEPSHAVFAAAQKAKELDREDSVVVTLSGRGDKDVHTVADAMGVSL